MSIEALNWAFGLEIEPQLKFTVVALANRADEEGMCYPGVRWIMKKTCYAESTVRTHLKELQSRRLLTKHEQHRPDGGQSTNQYRLSMLQPGLRLDPPSESVGGGAKAGPGGAKNNSGAVQKLKGVGSESGPHKTKDLNVSNKKERPAPLRRCPPDFCISDRVRAYAAERGYTPFLDSHFEKFMGHVGAKEPKYANWDTALINCIREDWGDVRLKAMRANPKLAPGVDKAWWQTAPGIEAKGRELGEVQGDEAFPVFKNRVFAKAGPGPWNEAQTAVRVAGEVQQRAHA